MADLKLPEINPIAVDRQPGAFERAGAEFGQGMRQVAQVPFEISRNEIMTQHAEAAAKVAAAKADTTAFIEANPQVNPDTLVAKYGSEEAVPPELLKDKSGQKRTGPISAAEYAVPLHTHLVDKAITDAAAGIEGAGWQSKFVTSQQTDAIPDRSRVQAHATQMQIMDQSVRNVSAYDSLVSSGNYGEAKIVADAIPNQAIRNAKLVAHDENVAKAEVGRAMLDTSSNAKLDEMEVKLQMEGGFTAGGQHVVLGRPEAETLTRQIEREKHRRSLLAAQTAEMAWKVEEQKTNDLISQFARISDQTGVPFAQVEQANRGYVGLPALSGDIPGAPGHVSSALDSRLKTMREGGYQVSAPESMAGWMGLPEAQLAMVQPDVMAKAITKLDNSFGQKILGLWRTAREKLLDGKPLSEQAIDAEVHSAEFLSNALAVLSSYRGVSVDPTTSWSKLPLDVRTEVDNLRDVAVKYRLDNPDRLSKLINSSTLVALVSRMGPKVDSGLGAKTLESVVDTSKVGYLEFGVKKQAAALFAPLSASLQFQGLKVTPDLLTQHGREIMNDERPLVDAAWGAAQESGDIPATYRVMVHDILMAPDSIQYRKAVDRLGAQGNTSPTKKDLINSIVWGLPEIAGGSREKARKQQELDNDAVGYNVVKSSPKAAEFKAAAEKAALDEAAAAKAVADTEAQRVWDARQDRIRAKGGRDWERP